MILRTASAVLFGLVASIAWAGDIFPAGAEAQMLWNEGAFTEGVAAAADGGIYFSDITDGETPGRVMKFDPATKETSVYCANSGQSNGLMFDAQGRLIAACGANNGRRSLAEILPDGTVQDLVTTIGKQHFNAPNDLVIHPAGHIYFSDPRYVGKESEKIEFDLMWIFRFDPQTKTVVRASSQVSKPNGLILSPDGKTLYAADTNNGSPEFAEPAKAARMALWAFQVQPDGSLEHGKILAEFDPAGGIDGMTMDTQGRVYTAFRNPERKGILVFDSKGKEVDFLPTADLPTNCCFGRGKEAGTLYMTVGTGLYRVQTNATGYHTTGVK